MKKIKKNKLSRKIYNFLETDKELNKNK